VFQCYTHSKTTTQNKNSATNINNELEIAAKPNA